MKIIKIVASTRCQILKLKCIKYNFGWGSAPDPAGVAYSAPPEPLPGFKGPTAKGWGGERREWRERMGSPVLFFCGSTPVNVLHGWD